MRDCDGLTKSVLFFFVVAVIFIGCTAKGTVASNQSNNATPSFFPHAAGWGEASSHGVFALQYGIELCTTNCHSGESSEQAIGPACTSCHALYPHEDDWATQEKHGNHVMANGRSACETLCHGIDRAGGLSSVACTKCHIHYPHSYGWSAAGSVGHGVVVGAEGSTQCEPCHGTNTAGTSFNAFCTDCHKKHLSSPTTCKVCHENRRPVDNIHPATQDCVSCHDYATGNFEILRGETITFDNSPHASTTGAFAAESHNTGCMRCHTKTGFENYTSLSKTEANRTQTATALVADTPDPLTCTSCHTLLETYRSGVTLDTSGFVVGDDPGIYKLPGVDNGTGKHIELSVAGGGICIRCHAPRSSDGAIKVNAWVYGMTEDTAYTSASTYTFAQYPGNTAVSGTKSSSQNRASAVTFHYYPIMATFYGSDVGQGFQYPTKTYVGKNNLMPGYTTCITCHNPHTTAAQPAKCATCHTNVSTTDDYKNIRVTTSDYDGDGDTTEGIYYEIEGVKAKLYQAIQNYASLQRAIVFSPATSSTSPWRRSDTNAVYDKFTPRLVKALYNYHLSYRDPAAYAHNSKYMVELFYDSIENLNAAAGVTPVDMTGMVRP